MHAFPGGSQVPASVSPRYLLEGAVYALEQCGFLLRDANLLYRSGSYASAVALTAFAQEELGRWKILLDLRRKILAREIDHALERIAAIERHLGMNKKTAA